MDDIFLKKDVDSLPESDQIRVVSKHPWKINAIKNPSEAVQLAAVKHNPHALDYILEAGITPPESVQLVAVRSNGTQLADLLKYEIKPSEAVQLAAVQEEGEMIYNLINSDITPSENVIAAAVKTYFYVLKSIHKSHITPRIKIEILKLLMYYIKGGDRFLAVDLFNILKDKNLNWPELNILHDKMMSNGMLTEAQDLNSATEADQIAAMQQNGEEIEKIQNPSEAVQLAAVENHGSAIIRIIHKGINPSLAVQTAAVIKNGDVLFYGWDHFDVDQLVKNSKVKTSVMKTIMSRQRYPKLALNVCKFLKNNGVNWPELDVIERQLKK